MNDSHHEHPRLSIIAPLTLSILLACLGLSMGAGCDGRTAAEAPINPAADNAAVVLPGVLVEPKWLAEHLETPGLVVIDVRDAERYAQGHIAGAINLPLAKTYHTDPPHKRDLAPVRDIEAAFSDAGLTLDQAIVIYDDGSDFRAASRFFWVLEVHGHTHVGVLNAGYQGWSLAQHPTTTQPRTLPPTRFISNMNPDRYATKLSVRRAIDNPNVQLIDARSAAEYQGLESRTQRAGHIPTARNIDAARSVLNHSESCEVKLSPELIEQYRSLASNKRVIAYCNSGRRASVSYLALRSLGINAAVYDGGWYEWGADTSLPVEADATPLSKASATHTPAP